LDPCWSRNPCHFLRSLFFPICQAETIFVSLKILILFSYGEHVSISAELLGRPRPDILFLKIGMGDISSCNIKSVDVFSVECEVEGVDYEVVLRELPATSELKAQSEAVCVAESFRDSSALHRGCALLLLHRNQSLQKYSCSIGAGR
jgi:hypothetical protein